MRLLESVGFGCAFLDFDQDGHQDVLLVSAPRCALYRNQGDGTFADVTPKSGLDRPGKWIGCAVGDYDNDGFPDVFISGYERSELYRNLGNGAFQPRAKAAGVELPGQWSTAATFSDFDRDGKLDLYVGAYCEFGPNSRQYCVLHENGVETGCRPIDYDPQVGRCFRNLGEGRFRDVTREWGLDSAHGKTLGAAVADFDGDAWPDLYLANDEMPGDLFQNRKGKGFQNVGVATGTAYSEGGQLMGGMGVDWGDYDRDGHLDLAIGTFEGEKKVLFRNLGGRSFEFAAGRAGILPATFPDVVFGTLLFDYDNDGWLDLLFTNGHTMDNIHQVRPTISYRQPARLFRNQGDGTFALVESASLAVPIAGRGLASGDYDGDGRLDLIVVDMDGAVRLLKNATRASNHRLQVALRGSRSNREALGARVTVTAGKLRQVIDVTSSRSYLSSCDTRAHFGLGSAARADTVEVRWPSGKTTTLRNIAADQVVQITEAGK